MIDGLATSASWVMESLEYLQTIYAHARVRVLLLALPYGRINSSERPGTPYIHFLDHGTYSLACQRWLKRSACEQAGR